ncbi:MAG TPA: outer membrane beta-barrel protein [Anaeromyxobacter sp.]|nr:outer membrane beta-barrel protein [Anaeromyxobacter sp.]
MNVRRPSLLLALAAAAALALPGAASAQARRPAGGTGFGILIGFEDSKYDNGLALRLDGEIPLQSVSPVVRLSLVGSLGFTRFSFNPGFFGGESETLNIFKVTPALRFTFGNHPLIRPYADAGIGLHYARISAPCAFDQFGNVDTCSDSDVSAHLRFAGGLTFQVSPGLGLGAEVDLIPYFGKVDDNTFSLLFVLAFRG